MSGHRIKKGPVFKRKPWRWGPPGWYCCGSRLMAAGTLQNGAPLHRCLHCGTVIAVAGEAILDEAHPGRSPGRPDQAEQLTFKID